MLRTVTEEHTKGEVLDLMEDLVRRWFDGKFDTLTEPQAYAVPLIHRAENVIVSSPTGSGKTLTAFLSVINELYALQKRGALEDKIYCLYVSPLKALANDINRNLREPLREMGELAEAEGLEAPAIRVGVRSGDTSTKERQQHTRNPPHIFITTPESLAIILSTPVFSKKFRDVRWVILDEIHEVCSNKRGVHLSLSLERLREQVGRDPVRVGLSATIAPMGEVAQFLAGYEDGEPRPMQLVEVESQKRLDMRVLCPVPDLTALPYEVTNARMYDLLREMIRDHRTTLVFTNTRSGTERVSVKLKERGVEDLEAHHGSLSKEVRLDVEERLKDGALNAVISSTSLELGIDIGHIDLVCQVGSPKSIAKGLQRIGRAGHAYGDTSVGRFIVFDNDDLLECAALVKGAYENSIDRVDIPTENLDVLAQQIVGMSLEKRWEIDEAFALVRRSYCYKDLTREAFLSVLRYLSSRNPDVSVYAKIWLDEDEGRFGRKRGSRMIYFTNVGTIPEEGNYRVFTHAGAAIGTLSEKFVEYLSRGDIFVLGGRTYRFERVRRTKVYVKDASGRRPTVPSWTGEMLPRSFDLSRKVGALRREVLERVDAEGEEAARRWLVETCRVDGGAARSVVNYLLEQRALVPDLPTDRRALIEGYVDAKGNRNLVFHYCFGRRTNDALARAYAFALSNHLECNARISVTDDNFMVTVPKRVELEEVVGLVRAADLEDLLRRAVRNTELFKQRFRHCATRAFMILRNYKGHEVSVGRQQLRSQKVLDWLHELPDFPVIRETYNEVLNEVMDLHHAREVLADLEAGRIEVGLSDWSHVPTPLAHNVVLAGISDIVLMEDRSALLRELHRQVLRRVVPEEQLQEVQFDEAEVAAYFRRKTPTVSTKEDLGLLLERAGALNLAQQKGRNPYDHAEVDAATLRTWGQELVESGEAASVWTPKGVLWAAADDVPVFAAVYARKARDHPLDKEVHALLEEGPKTAKELAAALKVSRVELNDALRRLERGYRVERRGLDEPPYGLRAVEPDRFEKALDDLVTRLLGFHGPLTLGELSVELGLEEELLRQVLTDLENEGTVTSGHFVLDESYQYMLSRDLRHLEAEEADLPVLEEGAVRAYRLAKQFEPLGDVDTYFDRFQEVGVIYDVWHRVRDFDMEAWYDLRREGAILEGRFLAGRVRYVRTEDAPLFASAYHRPRRLRDLERRILEAVQAAPEGLSRREITEILEEDGDRVKEALRWLDRHLYVIRRFTGRDAWRTKNVYVAFDPGEPVEDARATLVRRFLRGYGPVPFNGVKGYTGFGYGTVESLLDRLEEEGTVARILVRGAGDTEMYVLAEELDALEAADPTDARDELRVLSLYDPWVQPLWAEITSRYGEGWFYPVVRDGELAGMVEQWQMSGCLEIREVELADPDLLPELLATVQDMMGFYRQRGYDIVRIVAAFGEPMDRQEDLAPYREAGFHVLSDFVAWGEMVPDQYGWEEILAYVFYRQGIHPDRRFKTVYAAAEALGGLRSDFAAVLRARRFTALKDLHRQGVLAKGILIPPYLTYCTEADLELYRAAKDVSLDEPMEEVLELVREHEPVSKSRLLALAPFLDEVTDGALKRLYKGCCVVRDPRSRYRTVGDPGIAPAEARRRVLRRLFETYGVFSAENLGSYVRGAFNMAEIRETLRALEDEGLLTKGFLVEGDPTVYWVLRDHALGGVEIEGRFVLTPQDKLNLYLRDYLRGRWGLGTCYAIFEGPRDVAGFRARKRGDRITVTDYEGDPAARAALRGFSVENELEVRHAADELDEWEIIQWYERMYGSP